MNNRKGITLGFALVISSALAGPCLADTYNFDYSLFGGVLPVSASGTLTVGPEDPDTGAFPILSITGTRSVGGIDMQITGILPTFGPTSFEGSDNLLYLPGPPLLDLDGLSFSVSNADFSDDGLGDVNIYFSPSSGMYTEPNSGVGFGTFEVSPQDSTDVTTPEPSTIILVIGGLLGLAAMRMKRSWRLRKLSY